MNNLVFFHIDKLNSLNRKATNRLYNNLESEEWNDVYWGFLDEEVKNKYTNQLKNANKAYYIFVHYVYEFNVKIPLEITICEPRINNNVVRVKRICTLSSKEYVDYIMEETKILIDEDFGDYNDYLRVIESEEIFNRIEIFSCFEKSKTDGCLERQFDITENEKLLYDVNAISFSKSFRRLQDKAQIFTSSKGDHFRTRLTHTNDVVRISRLITRKINQGLRTLNSCFDIDEDEVEAIALGHDIGHTPFGHQGERTLNDIIGSDVIIKNGGKELLKDMGGFKHNIQSIRVLTHIEENSLNYDGLNISYRVLEGILKHSKYSKNDVKRIINKEIAERLNISSDLDRNCPNQEKISDYDNVKYKNTYLSGKIVNLSDEIAQRGSDIEDAVKSKKVKIEELVSVLKCTKYKDEVEKVININKETICIKKYDKEDIRLYNIKEGIIGCLIDDIASEKNIKNIYEYKDNYNLWFSYDMNRLNSMIEEIISNKVVMSQEVTKFDNDAKNIVIKLFKNYYENPRLLNDKVIHKIFFDMLDMPILSHYAVDFRNMNKKYVEKVINEIHNITSNVYVKLSKFTEEDEKLIIETPLNLIEENENDNKELELINLKIRYEQQKVIIRNICDYIAGMTDSFALEEYNCIK